MLKTISVVLLFLQEQFIQISHKTFNSQTLLIHNKTVKNNTDKYPRNINDIYKECIIKNGALMVNDTYDDPLNWKNIYSNSKLLLFLYLLA